MKHYSAARPAICAMLLLAPALGLAPHLSHAQATNFDVDAASPPPQLEVSSSARVTMDKGGRATVERAILFNPLASVLLRGSNYVAPASIAAFVARATRATDARCDLEDRGDVLAISCLYSFRVPLSPGEGGERRNAGLPDDTLVTYLAPLTLHYAYQLKVSEAAQVEVPGTFVSLPEAQFGPVPTSSYLERRYQLETASRYSEHTEATIGPGDGLSSYLALEAPRNFAFVADYFPSVHNWALLLATLLVAVACIHVMTPLRRLRTVQLTLDGTKRAGNMGVTLIVVGTLLAFVGLGWLRSPEWGAMLLAPFGRYLSLLPFATLTDVLDTGPFVALASGLVMAVLGILVLRWEGWARRLVVVLSIAFFFTVLVITPALILSPLLAPQQGLALLLGYTALLAAATAIVRQLQSAEVRIRYRYYLHKDV